MYRCEHPQAMSDAVCPKWTPDEDAIPVFPHDCSRVCEFLKVKPFIKPFQGVLLIGVGADEMNLERPIICNNANEAIMYLSKRYKIPSPAFEVLYRTGACTVDFDEALKIYFVQDGSSPDGPLAINYELVNKFINLQNKGLPRVEIFYEDLTIHKQSELLELFNIEGPGEMNWEIVPLFIMDEPEHEKIKEKTPEEEKTKE